MREEHKENGGAWIFRYSYAEQILVGLCVDSVIAWAGALFFPRVCTRGKAFSLSHRRFRRGVLSVSIVLNSALLKA